MTLADALGATPDAVSRLVRRHLPPGRAEEFLALCRPAVRLVPAGPGDPVCAHLGGAPVVPADFDWPSAPTVGVLPFIVEVDLGAIEQVAGAAVDVRLPTTGRLLAFHHDGGVESTDGKQWDPVDPRGARLLHVADLGDQGPGPGPPAGVRRVPRTALTGGLVLTWPATESVLPDDSTLDITGREFSRLFDDLEVLLGEEPVHLVGGWPQSWQLPAEDEFDVEPWQLLLQVDTLPPSDVDSLRWDWTGFRLYWGSGTDLPAHETVEQARFTLQI